jgi:benzoyl-CoA reductase/2-hydroxyglutaryl-CoA dehydratase subunit BcrC/BadD/HgdB
VFRLGVPHAYNTETGLRYYYEMVKRLKGSLEAIVERTIEEESLREAIMIYNRMRDLLKEISFLRKNEQPSLTGRQFLKLMHASFYLDPKEMVEILSLFLESFKQDEKVKTDRPRILLTGNMLAVGDYKVVDMVEESGGSIVMEQFCGGVRHYLDSVAFEGELLEAISRRYLCGRAPCAFMRPSKARLDLVAQLINAFNVDGVIWYQLRYCETYNMESFYFNTMMKKMGIPVLKLETEYDVEEKGGLLNRIESFIESLQRRR